MKFAGKLVYNKLVANLLVYLVFKFHSISRSSLKFVVVTSNNCEVLALWIFAEQPGDFVCFSLFWLGIFLGCLKVNCRRFAKISRKCLLASFGQLMTKL